MGKLHSVTLSASPGKHRILYRFISGFNVFVVGLIIHVLHYFHMLCKQCLFHWQFKKKKTNNPQSVTLRNCAVHKSSLASSPWAQPNFLCVLRAHSNATEQIGQGAICKTMIIHILNTAGLITPNSASLRIYPQISDGLGAAELKLERKGVYILPSFSTLSTQQYLLGRL